MNCIHCDRPAHSVCRFCGRAVCREHIQSMPFILEIFNDSAAPGHYKGLVVPDAVYCGLCKPKDEAVSLDPLK